MQGNRFPIWMILFILWTFFVVQGLWTQVKDVQKLSYSQFLNYVDQAKVDNLTITEHQITGEINQGKQTNHFITVRVDDPTLAQQLASHHIRFSGATENTFFKDVLSWVIPALVFFGLWMFIINRATDKDGMMGGVMSIGRSKARVYVEEKERTTFADVAGVDEAKEELQEVVTFLKEPDRYQKLGGRMPKGVILVGPPGTGKTLLARAVAGEAGVPFFHISGSEFVELFVGVGAARVRDLFEQATKKSPCIIFIDELDAMGKARSLSIAGSHDEKEQTLNQLLVELDGFDSRTGMVVLAATNRPEILDPALLRAGRFDRQVLVDRPDKKGRLEILEVHSHNIVMSPDVDKQTLAATTAGFTGADLANLVNEAALLAARRGADRVTMKDFNEAIERILAGLEKKNRLLNVEERRRVAYHEMGHTLLALSLPGADPVHKVSIIPRGNSALGYTMQRPTEDRFLMSRTELENRLTVLLGGRAAEMIVFNQASTGAADDLAKATDLARNMITRYGMAERLGLITYEHEPNSFLQKQYMTTLEQRLYSEETAREIDMEVRKLVDQAYKSALSMLNEKRNLLETAAKSLLEKETLTEEELNDIVNGHIQRRWSTDRPAADVVPIMNDEQKAV
jgi:cell division protease FtsH